MTDAFYGRLAFKRVDNVTDTEPSLLVRFTGRGDEVKDEITEALKETGWGWRTKDCRGCKHYRDHAFSFKVADLEWVISVVVSEYLIEEPVHEAHIRVALFLAESGDYRVFPVVFWPHKVHEKETRLGELISSAVRDLAYIACDADIFRDLICLADRCHILAYHDKRWLRRVDVVLKKDKVPYDFVVTYHFDLVYEHSWLVPCVSMSYSVTTRGRKDFDVLSEAIVDEYWREFIGGGKR
jgi:hypothetical protein